MKDRYLTAAIRMRRILYSLTARMPKRDERGVTSLEIAVYAAILLAVAIGLAALIQTAVGNHDATVK
jgi:hypothetical protein